MCHEVVISQILVIYGLEFLLVVFRVLDMLELIWGKFIVRVLHNEFLNEKTKARNKKLILRNRLNFYLIPIKILNNFRSHKLFQEKILEAIGYSVPARETTTLMDIPFTHQISFALTRLRVRNAMERSNEKPRRDLI